MRTFDPQDLKAARELIKRMGYINPVDLIYQLNHGMIINSPVTPKDVVRSTVIYGKTLGELKGKTIDKKVKNALPRQTIGSSRL